MPGPVTVALSAVVWLLVILPDLADVEPLCVLSVATNQFLGLPGLCQKNTLGASTAGGMSSSSWKSSVATGLKNSPEAFLSLRRT